MTQDPIFDLVLSGCPVNYGHGGLCSIILCHPGYARRLIAKAGTEQILRVGQESVEEPSMSIHSYVTSRDGSAYRDRVLSLLNQASISTINTCERTFDSSL
jgi:hypothetical protein